MDGIIYPRMESVTYKPGERYPNPSKAHLVGESERLAQRAEKIEDFFLASDNTKVDLNKTKGVVRLSDVHAPQLVDYGTTKVSGFYKDKKFSATGRREGSVGTSTVIRRDGLTFADRGANLNGMFLPNVQSLTSNEDGTLTYSVAIISHPS